MNPPFSDAYIASLYGGEYYNGSADYSYIDERRAKDFSRFVWDKRVEVLHRYARGGNFLDVGCSFGGLMESAERFYAPYGIELSPYSGGYAAATAPAGAVHIGTLKDHPFEHNFFSAISMIELIEHLKDPVWAIEECFRLLKPGGVLVLQTANMDGLQAKMKKDSYAYFLPGHLSYFSKKNLTSALMRSGFGPVKAFIPVEFGLVPKLRKSRGSFKSLRDYRRWLRISAYHMMGLLRFGNFCATSSMVLYAFKPDKGG
jgi:SAM-dependent methyltransferase